MLKKTMVVGITFLVMTFLFLDAASADFGACHLKTAKKGEVINATCPVMGGKVDKDTPYKTEYKGKTIGFCCAGCVEKFKANPEEYMAKLKKKCVIKCPNCGTEIDVMKECKQQGKMSGSCSMMN